MWCACRRPAPTTTSLPTALAPALADGWQLVSAEPHIKGRSGVAILSRHPIDAARLMDSVGAPPASLGGEFGSHGRYLEADTAGVTVASLYIQTGEAGTDRQLEKERFMAASRRGWPRWSRRAATRCSVATGTSRTPRTTSRTGRATSRSRVFCPASGNGSPICWRRAGSTWSACCIPTFPVRTRGGRGAGGPSTTTPGWRIDYQLATAGLAARAVSARVERAAAYALRWSDHAPVTVEYRV